MLQTVYNDLFYIYALRAKSIWGCQQFAEMKTRAYVDLRHVWADAAG